MRLAETAYPAVAPTGRHCCRDANRFDDLDDPGLFLRTEARSARQAQPAIEQLLGYGAPPHPTCAEHGLKVHGLPERPRFDVFRLERDADVLARCAEQRLIDRDARQPAVRAPIGRFWHELDTR